MQSAILVVDYWRPNLCLNRLHVIDIFVWVQLWGAPLKYQTFSFFEYLGAMIGPVQALDSSHVFLEISVLLDLESRLKHMTICQWDLYYNLIRIIRLGNKDN